MASYSTTSGFADLVGTCEITGDDCTSYTSNTLGAGTVTNLGSGSNLNFRVSFEGVSRQYVIIADANGSGFSGNANDNGPQEGEESWAATATTTAAGSGKSY